MNAFAEAVGRVRARLEAALAAAVAEGELPAAVLPPPAYTVEEPRQREHGDFAANLALLLARRAGMAPRQVAEAIARRLTPGEGIAAVEVAGPGFLNVRMAPGWLLAAVDAARREGRGYGRSEVGGGRRVLVEFVSANPTGPLNVVNARAAAFGDALVRVLNAAGYRAEREYYVNDAGRQFANLALAMEVRLRQLLGEDIGLPEGAYPGAYVIDLARAFLAEHGADVLNLPAAERRERLGRFAVDRIVAGQRATLEAYGVHFDRWVRESAVRAAGEPERVLSLLREAGHVYERDGAVWFRATAFGDDQDRVLVRQNGEATYFLPDVAYHLDKFRRDYDLCIDIWGQDHHGYVARMKAALSALGIDPARLEVLLTQIVRLLRGGQVVKMSKRGGEFVTMDELLEDVGRDAARFFFLMRTLDSHLDFDLDLAVRQSEDNPVYYVQYAHARICSILRQGAERGVAPPPPGTADLTLLADPSEEAVVRLVARFPAEVAEAAEGRAPHRLTAYCRELATAFHAFYARCRVLGEDPDLTTARLALVDAVRQVLANALELLGVSAPERM